MKKLITMVLIMSLFLSISQPMLIAEAKQLGYFAGPKYLDMTKDDCVELEKGTMSGTKLSLSGGGKAVFEFYMPFTAESMTIEYKGTAAPVTISNGTDSFTIEPGESTSYTYTFDSAVAKGEHQYTIMAETSVSIDRLSFNKRRSYFGDLFKEDSFILPDLSDEEYKIENAVLIHLDAAAIMVRGAVRYINLEDVTERPLNIEGTAYLPVHTLTRALNSYYEELPEEKYVLVRYLNKEMMFTPEWSYVDHGTGEKEQIENQVIFSDGRAFMPIRFFAETIGMRIGYREGLIAIDDNRFYIEEQLSAGATRDYIMSQLSPYMTEATQGKTYHVAQTANANDTNDGSVSAPFRTISRAGEVAKAGDTVIVHEGVYRETVTVKNNGTGNSPIVFRAAEGENVTISALEEITGFIQYDENTLVASYPWDLGKGRNQLFYKGDSIVEARYPNGPAAVDMGEGQEPLSDNWPVMGDIRSDPDNNMHFTSETLLQEEEENYWAGAYIVTNRGYNYAVSNAVVEKSSKGELWVTDTSTIYWDDKQVNQWNYAYLQGHRHAMDIPGEWVMENHVLFVIPPEGETAETLVLEGKKRQLVADLSANQYVHLVGFNTIGGSMRLNDSVACMIKDCKIEYNNHYILSKDQHSGFIDEANMLDENGAPARGEVGIYIGGRNNIFVGNYVSEAAAAAVYGVGLYTYIEENYIKNCGYAGSYVAGLCFSAEAWLGRSNARGGHGIYANTVYNAGRSPLVTSRPAYQADSWPVVPYEVAYNEFYNGMLTTLDTGIVYTYACHHGNDRLMTQMHNNIMYYTLSETNPYSFGIYHDGGTQNIDTYNNVVFTTEEGVILTNKPPVSTTSNENSWGNCNVWNNEYHIGVKGGRDGLKAEHYPDKKPFDAGSSYGRETYLVNYDSRSLDNHIYDYGYEISEVSEGVILEENGQAKYTQAGQWVKFSGVDFGEEGSNLVTLHYNGDRNNFDSQKDSMAFVLDDLKTGTSYNFLGMTLGSPYSDYSNASASRKIPKVTGIHDVYVLSKRGTAIFPKGLTVSAQTVAISKKTPGLIAAGDFDDYLEPAGASMIPATKYGEQYGLEYNFVNNTWRGMALMYYKVPITEATDNMVVNYATADGYHDQTIQVRVGSITAEPIAEFKTEGHGWTAWADYTIPLKETLQPGEYDIYITFDGENNAGKTCNIVYFKFHE